jgi:ABC-type bacteriocin/lantibiotic exporter with double-glycine peptidase domain
MDVADGQSMGARSALSDASALKQRAPSDTDTARDTSARRDVAASSEKRVIDPRVQALVTAARFYGMELDPADFRSVRDQPIASAASLSAWARASGLWSRAVRLSWRQLMRLRGGGPTVLLFADGNAGLLTGVDPDQNVVNLKDPRAPAGNPAIAVDELRLAQVWAGEAVLLRANRGIEEAEAPVTMAWLAALIMHERRSLRDIGIASLTLSFLTVFPPLLVMSVVDKVLTHRSYSTLGLQPAPVQSSAAPAARLFRTASRRPDHVQDQSDQPNS